MENVMSIVKDVISRGVFTMGYTNTSLITTGEEDVLLQTSYIGGVQIIATTSNLYMYTGKEVYVLKGTQFEKSGMAFSDLILVILKQVMNDMKTSDLQDNEETVENCNNTDDTYYRISERVIAKFAKQLLPYLEK